MELREAEKYIKEIIERHGPICRIGDMGMRDIDITFTDGMTARVEVGMRATRLGIFSVLLKMGYITDIPHTRFPVYMKEEALYTYITLLSHYFFRLRDTKGKRIAAIRPAADRIEVNFFDDTTMAFLVPEAYEIPEVVLRLVKRIKKASYRGEYEDRDYSEAGRAERVRILRDDIFATKYELELERARAIFEEEKLFKEEKFFRGKMVGEPKASPIPEYDPGGADVTAKDLLDKVVSESKRDGTIKRTPRAHRKPMMKPDAAESLMGAFSRYKSEPAVTKYESASMRKTYCNYCRMRLEGEYEVCSDCRAEVGLCYGIDINNTQTGRPLMAEAHPEMTKHADLVITMSQDKGCLIVKSAYNPFFINDLKTGVSAAARSWNSREKHWEVNITEGKRLETIGNKYFKKVVFVTNKSGGGHELDKIIKLLTPEAKSALYRVLAKYLHPDVPNTGNAEAMQLVNKLFK